MKNVWQKYLEYGLAHGAAEIEFFAQESKDFSVEIRQQKIEKLHNAADRGLAVRVICAQKLGFSHTTSLNEADIIDTIDQAITSAQYTATDPYWKLPKPQKIKKIPLKIFDRNILALTPKEKIKIALDLEKNAYKANKKVNKTETASFSNGISRTTITNSHGINYTEERTFCGVSLEIIASDKDKMEAGYDYQYTTRLNQLRPENVASTAAKRAVLMLDATEVPTGNYDLLLTPKVSINFLSVVLPMLCADNTQKNKSLLAQKRGQKIGSKLLTLIDDPFLPGGLSSYLFDGEGVAGKNKTIVKAGTLKQFLYDTYTANKEKIRSTGNAVRYSLKAEPGVGPSNFYLQPGKQTTDTLTKSVKHGLLIHNVMGLHTADPISGQFSLGAVGQLIENGKLTKAVKNIAIAGNLLEVLHNISAVGKELEFTPEGGALGAPAMIIKNIKVAGK